ncbi:MAG: response regulator [Candidatus Latescibacterota bacterium]
MSADLLAHLLVADDDEEDRMLVRDALRECDVPKEVRFVQDGEEALDYLHGRGRWACHLGRPLPDLILLDLKMPRKGGQEVLREIKAHPRLRRIPVVMLTTSASEEDIGQCYELGASSYIVKPVFFDQWVDAMASLQSYWFRVVTLRPEGYRDVP